MDTVKVSLPFMTARREIAGLALVCSEHKHLHGFIRLFSTETVVFDPCTYRINTKY